MSINSESKSKADLPICVAEVNVLKLHFSQLVEKVSCIYNIFYLRRRTKTNSSKKSIETGVKPDHQDLKYLFLFFKEFEHTLHVNERVLDHSGEKKITVYYTLKWIQVHLKLNLPLLTCSMCRTSLEACRVGWCRYQREQNLQPGIKRSLFCDILEVSCFRKYKETDGDHYLEFSFSHKVGTEKRAGQQTRSYDQVLGLVQEGQGRLGLPLRHLITADERGVIRMSSWAAKTILALPYLFSFTWYFKMASSKRPTS